VLLTIDRECSGVRAFPSTLRLLFETASGVMHNCLQMGVPTPLRSLRRSGSSRCPNAGGLGYLRVNP
jgi:hypothetical protein